MSPNWCYDLSKAPQSGLDDLRSLMLLDDRGGVATGCVAEGEVYGAVYLSGRPEPGEKRTVVAWQYSESEEVE